MGEDLSELVRNGFDNYRHNMNISIPFLLYIILILAMVIPTMILLPKVGFKSTQLIDLWIWVFLLAILLGSIFLAGTVGMARDAILEGKPFLKTMWTEGKEHYIGVLLVFLAGLCLIVPPFVILSSLFSLFIIGDATGSATIFLLFVPVILIFFLFAMALVYIVPVSIVVDDLGAAEGIGRGLEFIGSNLRDVLSISLLYLAAAIAIELAVAAVAFGASAIFEYVISLELEEYFRLLSIPATFIQVIVLYPLFIVLWTRIYMVRTGKLDEEGAEMATPKTPTDQKET